MQIELKCIQSGGGWNWLFEWRPANNGGIWRHINQNKVAPKQSNPDFMFTYREALNRVLKGETVRVNADFEHGRLLIEGYP